MYLEIKNLVKSYNSSQTVINNLSFSVEKGQLISFVGESGSGKSTFLKYLAGLEKINSGVISLNGKLIDGKDVFIRPQSRKIGYVFQDYPLFPHLNIKENIWYYFNEHIGGRWELTEQGHRLRSRLSNEIVDLYAFYLTRYQEKARLEEE